jgi:hypothetical protein
MKWGCDVRISHFITAIFQATRHQGLAGELGTGCVLSFWEDGMGAFGWGWAMAGCRGRSMVVCNSCRMTSSKCELEPRGSELRSTAARKARSRQTLSLVQKPQQRPTNSLPFSCVRTRCGTVLRGNACQGVMPNGLKESNAVPKDREAGGH